MDQRDYTEEGLHYTGGTTQRETTKGKTTQGETIRGETIQRRKYTTWGRDYTGLYG